MNLFSFLFSGKKPPAVDLRERLAARIQKRTGNRVRHLEVEVSHGKVIVSGDVASRYIWQLTLAAARGGLEDPKRLELRVKVNPQRRTESPDLMRKA